LGRYFGFQPPPVEFFVILAALVLAYLGIVEAAKRIFYRHLTIKPK
jgi:Mg2+-importing ATPase